MEDAQSIVGLMNPIIQTGKYTVMDEQLSVEDQLEFIHQFPERGVYHVAVSNDSQKVLGTQDVLPISTSESALKHVGEIATFVSLTAHRQGIGRSLNQATFRAAKERGFKKIIATIRVDNPIALAFYQNHNFEIIGTAKKHAFVASKYVDEVIAEKFL